MFDPQNLQVTFDPSNPYRRKSSLVSSDVTKPPLSRRPTRRDECIVHQFLESQRRANGAASEDGCEQSQLHSGCSSPSRSHANGFDSAKEHSDKAKVEPKSLKQQQYQQKKCRAFVDPRSLENNEVGQADQQAWTTEMTKSLSDMDLNHYEDQHSRTLTKKQLSDMAWGVRELSRRLSSIRIRFRVKTIFLLTKIYDQDLIPKTRELTRWLLDKERDTRFTVYIQDKLKDNKKFDVSGLMEEVAKSYADGGEMNEDRAIDEVRRRLRYWDDEMCKTKPQTFDFVITLGGDGTVLYASWLFQRIVPPVLSFALGSLGFLTKFDFDEYAPTLNNAFIKGVTVSLRLRFEGTVMRSQKRTPRNIEPGSSEEDEEQSHKKRDLVEELIGEEKEDAHTHRPDGMYEILNEIVVDRGPNPSEFHTTRNLTLLTNSIKQCHLQNFSATTNTLPPFKQMASASPPQLAQRRTTSLLVVPSATPRIRSCL